MSFGMKLPLQKDLYQPILEYLYDIETDASTSEIKDAIANYFYITEEERNARSETDSNYAVLQQRVDNACSKLCSLLLIERTGRGRYKISYKGVFANEHHFYIDSDYIKQLKSGDVQLDSVLPYPEVFHEFEECKDVTLNALHMMKMSNVRLNNMMMTKSLILVDGSLQEVTYSVPRIMCSSDEEYVANSSIASGTNESISIEVDHNSNLMRFQTEGRGASHNGPRSKKWQNPFPFDKNPTGFLATRSAIAGLSFNESMEYLLKNIYKISKKALANKVGVNERTIQRIMNGDPDKPYYPTIDLLYRIAIVLEFSCLIMQDLLRKANFDATASNPPYDFYMSILATCHGMSIADINNVCRLNKVADLFDVGSENDDDIDAEY